MRVLTLTNLYPNPYQPHRATFNRNQIRILGRRHPVRVISPIAWTDEVSAQWKGEPELIDGRRVILDGLEVEHPHYWYIPRFFRATYGRSYLASVRSTFARTVDEFRPDLLFAPWAYPDGWAAVELGRQHGIPVVVKVHGSDILLLDRHSSRTGPTAEALRRADAVVAVSQDLANRVIELGADPSRVRVIRDGVDKARFRPGPAADSRAWLGIEADMPVVLSVGNLVPVKGQDLLIEACSRLMSAGFRFTCYLIGNGPLRDPLEKLAAERKLGDRFRMIGAIPQDALADWYRSANVFALPSHSEGIPNVLLEAAACGVPFVASRVGGIPEIEAIGPSMLVPPSDPDALAIAIRTFLEKPMPADRPPGSVRDVSETVDDMEQLFVETIEARTRPSPLSVDPVRRPLASLKVTS
jgi:glycosyltransferase involved in cell wall biosynthesis